MLNFDEKRFVDIQTGAAQAARDVASLVTRLTQTGSTNLFFLGTGGAGILMEPAAHLLQSRSTLPTFLEKPAELVRQGSVHLGPTSIVVIPSRSGNTKESVEALSYCQDRGAVVVTLTAHADSPLAQQADHNVTTFAADDTSSESFYVQSLAVASGVLSAVDGLDQSDFNDVLGRFAELLLGVKTQMEPSAEVAARFLASHTSHIFTGAGSTWPEAHYYAMCILEEMQWIPTRPVHASDFFHGTLELVDATSSLVIFKGEDATRTLTDRVETFARTLTEQILVLDTKSFSLPGLSESSRSWMSPMVLATALERISAHLEKLRDHPLTTRRYYRQFDY
jgi:fructoselysine-6-phosphate deglycase